MAHRQQPQPIPPSASASANYFGSLCDDYDDRADDSTAASWGVDVPLPVHRSDLFALPSGAGDGDAPARHIVPLGLVAGVGLQMTR